MTTHYVCVIVVEEEKEELVQLVKNEINAKQRFSIAMSTCSILSAILVVWIHAYNVDVYGGAEPPIYWMQDVISQGIARGGVPFFLMSSAFFLYSKEKTIKEIYWSRARSVLLPYLLWNVIYMVAFTVLQVLGLTSSGMDQLSLSNVLQGLFLHKYNYAFWFMRDLIVLIFLYPLIRWILRRGKVASYAVLAALFVVFFCGVKWLESSCYYFVGVMLGYYYRERVESIVTLKKKWQIGITIGLFCVAAAFYWVRNICKIDSTELTMIRDLFIAFFMVFFIVMCNIRITGFFAGLSFMIYCIHPLLLEMIEKTIYLCMPHNDLWMVLDYVLAPILCILIITGVCALWKRWLPTVYKIMNGGRL